ncbi:c-type cytochrome [Geomesophilobacter sediminis]|uniref:Cytochrome c n=1 Tax=Geomesophilobacter sediminis TaxID=2798584 RepID=A0A8J7M2K2_9BACT|nr:cytochrome c [Geomesophilobacter sediminis]MBJ6727143.1 cytochrome c [Geomesophilobacter sediminis]
MPRLFVMLSGILFLSFLATAQARAEEGKELFQKLCASCHTIGGGNSVGPDLRQVTERHPADWLVQIITAPDKLAAAKDPAQLELVKKFGMEMPNLGVSRADAEKIIAFLGTGASAPAGQTESAGAPPVVVTPALLGTGRALFTGRIPFAGGGPPCVSCHTIRYPGVHGGTLAADLTGIYATMGDSGVRGVLQSLSFPVMKTAYANRPLKDQEIAPLIALFQDASTGKGRAENVYPYVGVGCFALFIVIALVVKRRIG